MNIILTPQLEEIVRSKVTSGEYASASEVIVDALRLMDERDQSQAGKLGLLRDDLQAGVESGPAVAWDAEETKQFGRAERAAKAPDGS